MVNATLIEYDESEVEDFLTEIYGQVDVCGYKYDSGALLKEIDPVAFRCVEADMPISWQCEKCCTTYEDEDEANECCAEDGGTEPINTKEA